MANIDFNDPDIYTGTITQGMINQWNYSFDQIDKKQNSLVSTENIKTINGASILGSGNILIETEENENDPNITQSQINNWNQAFNKMHTHSNKAILDNITGIKTVNGQSIIGNGNIIIEGNITEGTTICTINGVAIKYGKTYTAAEILGNNNNPSGPGPDEENGTTPPSENSLFVPYIAIVEYVNKNTEELKVYYQYLGQKALDSSYPTTTTINYSNIVFVNNCAHFYLEPRYLDNSSINIIKDVITYNFGNGTYTITVNTNTTKITMDVPREHFTSGNGYIKQELTYIDSSQVQHTATETVNLVISNVTDGNDDITQLPGIDPSTTITGRNFVPVCIIEDCILKNRPDFFVHGYTGTIAYLQEYLSSWESFNYNTLVSKIKDSTKVKMAFHITNINRAITYDSFEPEGFNLNIPITATIYFGQQEKVIQYNPSTAPIVENGYTAVEVDLSNFSNSYIGRGYVKFEYTYQEQEYSQIMYFDITPSEATTFTTSNWQDINISEAYSSSPNINVYDFDGTNFIATYKEGTTLDNAKTVIAKSPDCINWTKVAEMPEPKDLKYSPYYRKYYKIDDDIYSSSDLITWNKLWESIKEDHTVYYTKVIRSSKTYDATITSELGAIGTFDNTGSTKYGYNGSVTIQIPAYISGEGYDSQGNPITSYPGEVKAYYISHFYNDSGLHLNFSDVASASVTLSEDGSTYNVKISYAGQSNLPEATISININYIDYQKNGGYWTSTQAQDLVCKGSNVIVLASTYKENMGRVGSSRLFSSDGNTFEYLATPNLGSQTIVLYEDITDTTDLLISEIFHDIQELNNYAYYKHNGKTITKVISNTSIPDSGYHLGSDIYSLGITSDYVYLNIAESYSGATKYLFRGTHNNTNWTQIGINVPEFRDIQKYNGITITNTWYSLDDGDNIIAFEKAATGNSIVCGNNIIVCKNKFLKINN